MKTIPKFDENGKNPYKTTTMKSMMQKTGNKDRRATSFVLLCALSVLMFMPAPARDVSATQGSMLVPANGDGDLPSCGLVHANLVQTGVASWYGPRFHGRQTATGEIYDMYKMTAAHRTLPLNTQVRVTNSKNGESIVLRINDRGPYVHGRMIDLSLAAAKALGMRDRGTAAVKVQVLCRPAPEMILLSPPRKPADI